MYGAHVESQLETLARLPMSTRGTPNPYATAANLMEKGSPKTIIGQRHGAVLVSAGDGQGVWITHLKKQNAGNQHFFKLPSSVSLPFGPPSFFVSSLW
jgi:hypothetical protein